MDTPGLTQFKSNGQFVIHTAWGSWCSSNRRCNCYASGLVFGL